MLFPIFIPTDPVEEEAPEPAGKKNKNYVINVKKKKDNVSF